MTDKKSTDQEIIKALECCQGNWDCANCPYNDKCSSMHKDALDLINRLQAENERLNEIIQQQAKKQKPIIFADEKGVRCLNCECFMFSDMYGECSKFREIVNPADSCLWGKKRKVKTNDKKRT